jgi:predicted acyl esterase
LAWYRHWLDDGPKPRFMRTRQRARWFEMSEARNGAGTWRHSRTWPPNPGSFRTLYLRQGGTLSHQGPGADEAPASLRSDPLAGTTEWPSKWDDAAGLVPMSDADQRPDEARGLTFTTPVLGRDLVVAGPIALHLEAATRPLDGGLGTEAGLLLDTITGTLGQPGAGQVLPPRLDADWVVKLSDVAPDGTSTLIQSGFLRASHRRLGTKRTVRARGRVLVPWHTHRAKHVQGLKAGKPYSLDIEVWPTAKRFPAGHRLRIALYHADTPNHLTQLRPIESTISLDRARPSYLLLGKP